MSELETEFMRNPINFLRNHALSPPDGSPGDVIKQWDINTAGNIIDGVGDFAEVPVKLKGSGSDKKWATFRPHGTFPGALTVDLADAPPTFPRDGSFVEAVDRPAVPMYWLPWESLSLVSFHIPPVPGSLVEPDEDVFPRFFMTAGINGCSVFVEGPAHSPTIIHAGITGKLARPSDEFWMEQLSIAKHGTPQQDKAHMAVHSKDYMGVQRQVVQDFELWKNAAGGAAYRLEITSCFGSLIGVRFGRNWSFYLQENVYTQDVQILKSRQVDEYEAPSGSYFQEKTTNTLVHRGEDIRSPRRVGPVSLGTKVTKTYLKRTNQTCRPIQVGEIYPTNQFKADFRTTITSQG